MVRSPFRRLAAPATRCWRSLLLLGVVAAPAVLHAEGETRAPAAAVQGEPRKAAAPAPKFANVAYGPHARNVLDFWPAPAASAEHLAPVVVYIHGGGFVSGDKNGIRQDAIIPQCLAAGVSFASISYRYLDPNTPLQDILRDCARAIQFLRSRAAAWHIDKPRIAAYGSSAGAGTSLWLAAHADLADPSNRDPVLRESSRLACAGLISPQFSYDWLRWREFFDDDSVRRFSGIYDSPSLYGFTTAEALRGPEGQRIRSDCDMFGLLTKDTPPIFVTVSLPTLALENSSQFLHHPRHAELIYNRCRELAVPVYASIPALKISPPPGGPRTMRDFLLLELGVKPAPASVR